MHGLVFNSWVQNRARVDGPSFFPPCQIDHPVVLGRLERNEIEVQPVGDTMDVVVGQRMFPSRIAEHGCKVGCDMLAHPQQCRKAILSSRECDDYFHVKIIFVAFGD